LGADMKISAAASPPPAGVAASCTTAAIALLATCYQVTIVQQLAAVVCIALAFWRWGSVATTEAKAERDAASQIRANAAAVALPDQIHHELVAAAELLHHELSGRGEEEDDEEDSSASTYSQRCNDGVLGAVLASGAFVCTEGSLLPAEMETAAVNFAKFDIDGDGLISRDDFVSAMGVLDAKWSSAESQSTLDAMFAASNLDGSGFVTPAQFAIMRVLKRKKAEASHSRRAAMGLLGRAGRVSAERPLTRPPLVRVPESSHEAATEKTVEPEPEWPSPPVSFRNEDAPGSVAGEYTGGSSQLGPTQE